MGLFKKNLITLLHVDPSDELTLPLPTRNKVTNIASKESAETVPITFTI